MAFIPPWGEPVTDSLTGYSKFFKVFLEWADASYEPRFYRVELFRSLTNNRAAAISLGFPENNKYEDADVSAGLSYYYWVQDYNFDDTPQGYYPVSATAGVQVDVPYVVTNDLASGAVSEVTAVVSNSVMTENNAYGLTTDVESFTITGNGSTAIFVSSLGEPTVGHSMPYNSKAKIHIDRRLVNTSQGGTPLIILSKSNYGSYQFFNGGNVVPFQNPANVKVQDASASTGLVSSTFGVGDPQYYYGYDFSAIPFDAHLLGIQVMVRAYHAFATDSIPFIRVHLCWDGVNFPTLGGNDVSAEASQAFTTGAYVQHLLGSPEMLTAPWVARVNNNAQTISYPLRTSDVLDPNFGVIVTPFIYEGNIPENVQFNIDFVQVTVFYSMQDIVQRSFNEPIAFNDGEEIKNNTITDTFVQFLNDGEVYQMVTQVLCDVQDKITPLGDSGTLRMWTNTTRSIITELKR